MHSDAISKALAELDVAKTNVRRAKNRQVRSAEDRDALRATAQAWFYTHRPTVLNAADASLLAAVDEPYQVILRGADRNTQKTIYLGAMALAKDALIDLRSHLAVVNVAADAAPDLSPLTNDAEMKAILERRWIECTKCVNVKADLAAIVMMGGLLEALFVARAAKLADKSILVKAASAPRGGDGKVEPIDKWMLNSYLQVGHELKWITDSAYKLAGVLGEFRNYVHPAKERRHGVVLGQQDSLMLWGVTKSLVAQLLHSATK